MYRIKSCDAFHEKKDRIYRLPNDRFTNRELQETSELFAKARKLKKSIFVCRTRSSKKWRNKSKVLHVTYKNTYSREL